MGPEITLISPRQLSNLGAAGGSMVELSLPPHLNDQEGEAVDRLYQDTMDQYYAIGTTDGNNPSFPETKLLAPV